MFNWFKKNKIETEKRLKELIAEVEDKGIITEDEEELVNAIFELDRTLAGEVMVPRTEMKYLPVEAKIKDIIKHFKEKRHTKIPVYKDTLDNIVGMIYMTEILPLWGERKESYAGDLMRLPYFIPYTKNIMSTLREFQNRHISIAIVLDEFGGVAGLVTTEDIIEEIVGELQDELDKEKTDYKVLDDGSIVVPGIFEIDRLKDIMGVEYKFEEIRTICGLLIDHLERVPEEGEEIEIAGSKITILKASNQRIKKVRIKKL